MEEEEDDDNEGDALFSHNTFEDFLFRRRPQSSYSSTASDCSTAVSDDEPSPPPSPRRAKTPLPPVSIRRCSGGMTLGLARSDVDFIHDIIRRPPNNHHAGNRIAALKEAYVRAANNQLIPANACQSNRRLDNESFLRRKIRDELERYNELPFDLRSCSDDEDERVKDHVPSTVHRLFNFISTVKRRARSNIRHMKRNFQTLRSRLFIEHIAMPTYQYGYRHRTYVTRPFSQRLISIASDCLEPAGALVTKQSIAASNGE